MNEYEKLCHILNDQFLSTSQDKMEETKGCLKPQRVSIDNGNKTIDRTLYRFNFDDFDFLPFLNKKETRPEGLRKFCDYILIAKYQEKTYVLLIELKRGGGAGASLQLNASKIFLNYLFQTAERLATDFADTPFDTKKVKVRKIVVKEIKSNKQLTQIDRNFNKNQDPILYKSSGQFLLSSFL